MDLEKVMVGTAISGITAKKAKDLVEALEQLPLDIPNPKECFAEAYQKETDDTINLSFAYESDEVVEKINLDIPSGAINIKRDGKRVEFDYNNRHYDVHVFAVDFL